MSAKDVARPHARELVGVAHKYQPAVRRQGGQQGLHKRYVNHGALVQHHRPAVQRRVLVVRENDALALGLEARAQQAVDGGRLAARQLAHALGRAAGGRGEQRFDAQRVEKRQYGADGGGLAGAGPAREGHHAAARGEGDGLALQWRIGDAGGELHAPYQGVRVHGRLRRLFCHQQQAAGDVVLRFAELGKVAGVAPGDLAARERAVLHQRIERGGGRLLADGDELRRGGDELFRGDEAVPVGGVVPQLEHHRRAHAVGVVGGAAHAQRERVRLREGAADVRRGEDVGVLLQDGERIAAVEFIEPDGQQRPQGVGTEQLHQPPQAGLPPEGGADLLGLARRDAAYLRQPCRLALDDVERLVAELFHDEGGRGRAHALHGVPRQVGIDVLRRARQAALGVFGLELPPVVGVSGPLAVGPQLLARIGGGQRADNGGEPAVQRVQPQDGPAVLLVGVDNGGDTAAYFDEFRFFRHIPSRGLKRWM